MRTEQVPRLQFSLLSLLGLVLLSAMLIGVPLAAERAMPGLDLLAVYFSLLLTSAPAAAGMWLLRRRVSAPSLLADLVTAMGCAWLAIFVVFVVISGNPYDLIVISVIGPSAGVMAVYVHRVLWPWRRA